MGQLGLQMHVMKYRRWEWKANLELYHKKWLWTLSYLILKSMKSRWSFLSRAETWATSSFRNGNRRETWKRQTKRQDDQLGDQCHGPGEKTEAAGGSKFERLCWGGINKCTLLDVVGKKSGEIKIASAVSLCG